MYIGAHTDKNLDYEIFSRQTKECENRTVRTSTMNLKTGVQDHKEQIYCV